MGVRLRRRTTDLVMAGKVMIVSGEASGDKHGAHLMEALKKLDPDLRVTGMGGERMMEAGLDGVDSTDIAVVGIVEVIGKFSLIRKIFHRMVEILDTDRPDCVVLIDYPDFNLRLAREIKKRDIPVVYYISPQVWAWRKRRVHEIARVVDKMLVVFPFEVPFYEKVSVDVEYVGHPLVDTAKCDLTKEDARRALGLDENSTYVAILPGSRTGEIKRLLHDMVASLALTEKRLGRGVKGVIPAAPSVSRDLIEEYTGQYNLDIKIVDGRMYEVLRAADSAVVASGTATLETALIGTPMVIAYRVAPVSYLIARVLVDMDVVGMPNILAGERIVPEFLQDEVTAEHLAAETCAILKDNKHRDAMVRALADVKEKLGVGGATERVAKAVHSIMTGEVSAPVKSA